MVGERECGGVAQGIAGRGRMAGAYLLSRGLKS